jgi:arylsulfatase A-like enzyme
MCHFPHSHRSSYFTSFRKGDWKLVYRYLTNTGKRKSKKPLPKYELYDLKNDPYETKNLALENTKKTNEMIRLMTEQLERENALFPVQNDHELRPQLIQ